MAETELKPSWLQTDLIIPMTIHLVLEQQEDSITGIL